MTSSPVRLRHLGRGRSARIQIHSRFVIGLLSRIFLDCLRFFGILPSEARPGQPRPIEQQLYFMKTIRKQTRNSILVAIGALAAGLTACTTYVDQRPVVYQEPPAVQPAPPPVYAQPTTVEVVIREERDFYEPLSPYGRWEYIGSYGRCWVPAGVDSSWRPYCNGHWESTDAGWYWVSDEPWGWATYHYG